MNVEEFLNGLKENRPELFLKDSGQTLYCDGGVIGRNPSDIGGTYAFILVAEDGETVLAEDQGLIPCSVEHGPVTNNVSELTAALQGLTLLPPGWTGTIASDSQITLGRLCDGWALEGIPSALQAALAHFQRLFRLSDRERIRPLLLGGHPSKRDIESGYRAKDGAPVSKWNVECDLRCKRLAAEVLKRLKIQPSAPKSNLEGGLDSVGGHD